MVRTIREGMCHMSAKQKPHTPTPNTAIQNTCTGKCPTIYADCNGPYHGITQKPGIRQHPNHSRSRVYPRRNLLTMYDQCHGTTNRPTILSTRVPMVRTPPETDHRSRSPIHITLRQSPRKGTGNYVESNNGLSPSNRWTIRKKEPMGRTIPPTHRHQSRRLGNNPPPGHVGTQ